MYNKIFNPKTGRNVNINSYLGKQILTNYLNQLGGNICGFNMKTKRCSKKILDRIKIGVN